MATLTIADLDNGKRDLQTVDEVANSRAATATTRFGQQTTTLYEAIRRIVTEGDAQLAEQKESAETVIRNLGFMVPVPYAPGIEVTESNFTVIGPDGNIYAAQAGQIPFTTGAWDSAKWYPIQNDLNDHKLLVFNTLAEAEDAAATLPDGQVVEDRGALKTYTIDVGLLTNERPSFPAGVGTAGRSQQQRNADAYSIKDFGAAGDGVTDDTLAFSRAVAAINSGVVGSLEIPQGKYKITQNIPAVTRFVKITGAGRRNCWLVFYGCDGLRFDFSSTSGANGGRYINCSLSDLTLLTNTTGKTGLYFRGLQSYAPHDPALVLSGVSLDTMSQYDSSVSQSSEWLVAVDTYDADEVYITDCFINGSSKNANFTGVTNSTGLRASECTGLRVNNTQFFQVGVGIDLSGQSEGLIAYGITAVACNYGIYLHDLINPSNNHVISGSHFACYAKGIFVNHIPTTFRPLAVFISDCFLLERGPSAEKTEYVAIDASISRSVISNVVIQNNTLLTPSSIGIRFTCDENVIHGVIGRNLKNFFIAEDGVGYSKIYDSSITGGNPILLSGAGSANVAYSNVVSTSDATPNIKGAGVRFKNASDQEIAIFQGGKTLLSGGSVSGGNTYIDFRSKVGGASSWDARILSTGGSSSGVDGMAAVYIYGSPVIVGTTLFRALSDNSTKLGASDFRWSEVYAATGTINTSDAREKTTPNEITDAVLDAWGDVQLITFRWLKSIAEKSESARWHFGVIAQQVRDAFITHGLDGTAYGLLCYDEWDAEPAVLDENGEEVTPAREAGNRWGIRADQCLFLEAAYQRRRADRIEARLTAIEARL